MGEPHQCESGGSPRAARLQYSRGIPRGGQYAEAGREGGPMKSRILLALGLGLTLAAMSCKEGPTAGELEANLTTPNSDDGALQFTATAAANVSITGISQACSGCKLFVVKVSDTQYRGVVT